MANRYLVGSFPRINHVGLELAHRHDSAGHPLHGSWRVRQPNGSILYSDGGLGTNFGGSNIFAGRGTAALACGSLRACRTMAAAFRPGGFPGCVVGHVDIDGLEGLEVGRIVVGSAKKSLLDCT